MRLDSIQSLKSERGQASQPLYSAPLTLLPALPRTVFSEPLKRRILRLLAPVMFPFKLRAAQLRHGAALSDWDGLLACGYRFSGDWVQQQFARTVSGWTGKRVLIPGTHFNTKEAREWIDRPVSEVHLLDIVDWGPSLEAAAGQIQGFCKPTCTFHHGTLDRIPLADGSIDIIESRAVLEHVGNMVAAAAETARVLTPEGVALHSFGPLYFTHGGDHCISAYGVDHGFDHLLLDQASYMEAILDEEAFQKFGAEASDSRYWAIQQIFSYLKPQEYLETFAPYFDIVLKLGMISDQAVSFRRAHPSLWQSLLGQGLRESDLLIGSMTLILRKKNR